MKTLKVICFFVLFISTYCIKCIAQENQSYFLHTIEKGQSLYSIATMYGIAQDEIIQMNPGSEKKIYIGHTLRIPRKVTNTQQETYHTIAAGETLYRLTKQYNVSAQSICNINPGLSANNFRIGQVIRIPVEEKGREVYNTETNYNSVAPIQARCREMHKVKRKETIFSISRQYDITQEELIEVNPELKGKKKLKKGSLLCIPYPKAIKEEILSNNAPSNQELFNKNHKEKKDIAIIKAAIILPFLDGVPQNEVARMVEYYEGVLIAVDSLKRSGVSIELHTYNSGTSIESLNTILAQSELKDMNVIFGPLYQQQIKPLADFAQQNNIRMVIPFSAENNIVFRNPAVYQINTPQSYLYSEVYDHFIRQFPQANIIFLEATHDANKKIEFIKGLKDILAERNISFKSIPEDATSEEMKAALNNQRENVFIPTSGSNLTLIKILPQLTLTVRELPEAQIHLFGYPEWQTYTKDHLNAFFELDTYFYSSFYTNNLLPASINFTKNYRHWYSKEMVERYPKYGMLGFDTAYFFLKGLSRYGSAFEQEMNNQNLIPIQTGFKFQRVNNWGGFINKKVFFVHFTKNYELLKLDFD